jgi:tetratricopeptide (TPR) repeat protein
MSSETKPHNDRAFWTGICVAVVVATYVNHFHNAFHFDDSHTIESNYWIRSLTNIPRFFTDARTFSTIPSNMTYRPLVSTILAIDYAIGGLNPLVYHITVFMYFLALLVSMFFLFSRLLKGENEPLAAFATVVFGVHPACAETVNYVIQSADLYVALAMVVSLLLYIKGGAWRDAHTLPLLLGALCKPTILIFPLVLAVYQWLYEDGIQWRELMPSLAATAALGALHHFLTPRTYSFGSMNPRGYYMTQPWVVAYFVRSFFWPTHLSADADWDAIISWSDPRLWMGCAVIVLLLGMAAWAGRRHPAVSFGIAWFMLTLLPTALAPLAEVVNDHRMFGPFVGFTLAMAGLLGTLSPAFLRRAALAAPLIVLLLAIGTVQRNRVWRTEESLWRDVTIKSPRNGRGWMNYGLTQMAVGHYQEALESYQRGLQYVPNYSLMYINMAIDLGAMHRDREAEDDFKHAIELDTTSGRGHYYYARWLDGARRYVEAEQQIRMAIAAEPTDLQMLDLKKIIDAHVAGKGAPMTADTYIEMSLDAYRAGRYDDCVNDAKHALQLKPDSAAAYNNVAAGYLALHEWDLAIDAAQKAIQLQPDFQLAKNNLAAAQAGKNAGDKTATPSPYTQK